MTPTQLVRLIRSDTAANHNLQRTFATLRRFRTLNASRALKLLRGNVRDGVRLAGHGVPLNVQDSAAHLLLTAYQSDAKSE